jgi:phage terminase large subunit-like protein
VVTRRLNPPHIRRLPGRLDALVWAVTGLAARPWDIAAIKHHN